MTTATSAGNFQSTHALLRNIGGPHDRDYNKETKALSRDDGEDLHPLPQLGRQRQSPSL